MLNLRKQLHKSLNHENGAWIPQLQFPLPLKSLSLYKKEKYLTLAILALLIVAKRKKGEMPASTNFSTRHKPYTKNGGCFHCVNPRFLVEKRGL